MSYRIDTYTERVYARACLGLWRERLATLDAYRYDGFTGRTNL